jgi:hypothetical protein
MGLLLTSLIAAGAMGAGPHVDNPWFPLKPGTTLVYRGVKDGTGMLERFRVTGTTKLIDGVRCRVVDDRSWQNGHLAERTRDYYAQDRNGTVWYFGEDTAELDASGRVVSRAGSWHSGRGAARAGIFMPARPHVGEHHFQEHDAGNAEDQFRVVSLQAHVTVPYGSFAHALRTREWTTLEPDVVDAKYYVRGIGEVFEGSQKGPAERSRLVAIRHGAPGTGAG